MNSPAYANPTPPADPVITTPPSGIAKSDVGVDEDDVRALELVKTGAKEWTAESSSRRLITREIFILLEECGTSFEITSVLVGSSSNVSLERVCS
jgi:hypothetical protein